MTRKSKTNSTFFTDIPKPKDDIATKKNRALEICRALSNYTHQRRILLEEIREYRKKIYNLSLEINRLHEENEAVMNGKDV